MSIVNTHTHGSETQNAINYHYYQHLLSKNLHYILYAITVQQDTLVLIQIHNIKVKASHTRYRALGPQLIPVYRR